MSNTVGVTDNLGLGAGVDTVQLQRIVSRCVCQFFYVGYGEDVDADEFQEAIPLVRVFFIYESFKITSAYFSSDEDV